MNIYLSSMDQYVNASSPETKSVNCKNSAVRQGDFIGQLSSRTSPFMRQHAEELKNESEQLTLNENESETNATVDALCYNSESNIVGTLENNPFLEAPSTQAELDDSLSNNFVPKSGDNFPIYDTSETWVGYDWSDASEDSADSLFFIHSDLRSSVRCHHDSLSSQPIKQASPQDSQNDGVMLETKDAYLLSNNFSSDSFCSDATSSSSSSSICLAPQNTGRHSVYGAKQMQRTLRCFTNKSNAYISGPVVDKQLIDSPTEDESSGELLTYEPDKTENFEVDMVNSASANQKYTFQLSSRPKKETGVLNMSFSEDSDNEDEVSVESGSQEFVHEKMQSSDDQNQDTVNSAEDSTHTSQFREAEDEEDVPKHSDDNEEDDVEEKPSSEGLLKDGDEKLPGGEPSVRMDSFTSSKGGEYGSSEFCYMADKESESEEPRRTKTKSKESSKQEDTGERDGLISGSTLQPSNPKHKKGKGKPNSLSQRPSETEDGALGEADSHKQGEVEESEEQTNQYGAATAEDDDAVGKTGEAQNIDETKDEENEDEHAQDRLAKGLKSKDQPSQEQDAEDARDDARQEYQEQDAEDARDDDGRQEGEERDAEDARDDAGRQEGEEQDAEDARDDEDRKEDQEQDDANKELNKAYENHEEMPGSQELQEQLVHNTDDVDSSKIDPARNDADKERSLEHPPDRTDKLIKAIPIKDGAYDSKEIYAFERKSDESSQNSCQSDEIVDEEGKHSSEVLVDLDEIYNTDTEKMQDEDKKHRRPKYKLSLDGKGFYGYTKLTKRSSEGYANDGNTPQGAYTREDTNQDISEPTWNNQWNATVGACGNPPGFARLLLRFLELKNVRNRVPTEICRNDIPQQSEEADNAPCMYYTPKEPILYEGRRDVFTSGVDKEFSVPLFEKNLQEAFDRRELLRSIATRNKCVVQIHRRLLNKKIKGGRWLKYFLVNIWGKNFNAIDSCDKAMYKVFEWYRLRKPYNTKAYVTMFFSEDTPDNTPLAFSSQRTGVSGPTLGYLKLNHGCSREHLDEKPGRTRQGYKDMPSASHERMHKHFFTNRGNEVSFSDKSMLHGSGDNGSAKVAGAVMRLKQLKEEQRTTRIAVLNAKQSFSNGDF